MQYRQATNLQKKKKRSQFAYQLKAKQLISTLYGNLNTQYFKTLYKKCKLLKGKNTINFFSTLEKRLDCIISSMFCYIFTRSKTVNFPIKRFVLIIILFQNRVILLSQGILYQLFQILQNLKHKQLLIS